MDSRFESLGGVGGSWVFSWNPWGPHFLSLGGHFEVIFGPLGTIWGAFGGHFGSLGGSFGGLGAVFLVLWSSNPPWFNQGRTVLEAKVGQVDQKWSPKWS